jgi:hypothetical protein
LLHLLTAAIVQVFGRRADETINAHRRPASENRQGTKSWNVSSGGAARYGDLAAGSGAHAMTRSGSEVSTTRSCAMALYDAFISYSHAKDKPIAAALQSVVQKLGKPWYRRRALRVFRDDNQPVGHAEPVAHDRAGARTIALPDPAGFA